MQHARGSRVAVLNMLDPGGLETLSLLPTYLLPPWQYCEFLSGFLVVNHGIHTA